MGYYNTLLKNALTIAKNIAAKKAEQEPAGETTPPVTVTPPAVGTAGGTTVATRDWARDTTDWAAGALNAQSQTEIQTLLDGRTRKAQAQGIDISGADPRYQSNEQIYQQWWNTRGKYIPDKFGSWDGTDGVGYYGTDETGDHGYYADPERTIKLANGNWGKNPNGGESRSTTGRSLSGDYYDWGRNARFLDAGGYGGGYGGGSDALAEELMSLYRGQDSAYARALAEQKAAQDAAVKRATDALSAQRASTNGSYADLFRQLYIDKMNAQKNIDQRMAAQGVTGGAAESTLLALAADYEDALRQGEQERIGTIAGLDRAISEAQLSGDIANAQAAAELAQKQTDNYAAVLKTLIDRYDTIAARQESYAREDAQLAQKYAYERERDAVRSQQQLDAYARESAQTNRDYAYKNAMQLINSGALPDGDLLAAAGIGAGTAQAMVNAVLAERSEQAAKPKLSAAQVNAALKAGRLTPEVLSAYEYWYGAPYRG